MKLKRSLTILTAMAFAMAVLATPVDRQTAARAAMSFWKNTLHQQGIAQLKDLSDDLSYGHLYLFAIDKGGFILMSADDVARPVLAYSTSGTFNPANPPLAIQPILEQYALEIASASQDPSTDPDWQRLLDEMPMLGSSKEDVDSLGPLVQTQWYQLTPYNDLCPSGCPTGCVATAAAQVMRYWSYPAFGKGSHSYTSDGGYGVLSADFAHTLYDWENMPARVTYASPADQRTAVATLMYHIGVSVHMGYNPMQSGAAAGNYNNDSNTYCAQNSFWRYFHYNRQSLQYVVKGNMSNDDWTEILIAELRQLRPIMYDGTGSAGGHSFICDGFDSRRYMHFNLGEDGEGDGFYAIGAISHGSYSFNMNNNVVIGIQPEYGLYLSDSALNFDRNGGTQQVWLTTCDTIDVPWSASCTASWVTLSDTAFQHLGQVSVTVEDNVSGTERTATVIFQQQGRTARLTITQAAYSDEEYCPLNVVMECTRTGSSWANDAHLSFESPTGHVYGTASHTTTDRISSATVRVSPGQLIIKYHRGGPQDRYYNYWVTNQHGDTLAAVVNAYYNASDITVDRPCSSLAIDPVSQGSHAITLYPNPASSQLSVAADTPISCLIISDIYGRSVLQVDAMHRQQLTVDTSVLPKGTYLVGLVTESGIYYNKVLITNTL